MQNLFFSFISRMNIHQLRIFRNEIGVAFARSERGMIQHVEQERNIGLNAFYFQLLYTAHCLVDAVVKRSAECGYLNQQAVVIRSNLRAGYAVAAVQTDTKSRTAAVQL